MSTRPRSTRIRRIRRVPLALAATAALLVATTAPAQAAPVSGGAAVEGENVVRGAGSGSASADVDEATGAMSLTSSARGGQNLLTPLGIAFLGGPTSAGATGSISQRLGVYDAGTYDIVVTFAGAASSSRTTGSGTASELRSVFGGVECGEECARFAGVPSSQEPAGSFEAMPDEFRTVTSTLRVEVPAGERALLYANVAITAGASAHRRGNSATSTASADSITTEVVRVG